MKMTIVPVYVSVWVGGGVGGGGVTREKESREKTM